ncbi:hypothetical protein PSN01_02980 [Micromonospora saelicesensis]|nr:hypothetical protein PSN01_02980 [Micromonospora saelicesensis]
MLPGPLVGGLRGQSEQLAGADPVRVVELVQLGELSVVPELVQVPLGHLPEVVAPRHPVHRRGLGVGRRGTGCGQPRSGHAEQPAPGHRRGRVGCRRGAGRRGQGGDGRCGRTRVHRSSVGRRGAGGGRAGHQDQRDRADQRGGCLLLAAHPGQLRRRPAQGLCTQLDEDGEGERGPAEPTGHGQRPQEELTVVPAGQRGAHLADRGEVVGQGVTGEGEQRDRRADQQHQEHGQRADAGEDPSGPPYDGPTRYGHGCLPSYGVAVMARAVASPVTVTAFSWTNGPIIER